MSESSEVGAGKARKRLPVKTQTSNGPVKVKATLHLSVEADQRLSVHATMLKLDRSELIESLINQHLRRFVVSDRGGPESANGGDAAA